MSVAALDNFEDPDYPFGDTGAIQKAWAVMAGGSVRMAKVLLNLAENSKSDYVKVQAAVAVLDRVGLTGTPDISINLLGDSNLAEQQETATKLVIARLDALAAADGVIDGEVIDDVLEVDPPDVQDMFD